MTHVKNAEAFAMLVDFCTGYGGIYNPGRPTLQLTALTEQKTKAAGSLANVIAAKTGYDNQVNMRKQLFDQLQPLAARVMRLLEASGASREKLDDARAYVKQISGASPKSNAPPAPVESPAAAATAGSTNVAAVKQRSKKQLSFPAKADAFAKLVSAVSAEPRYVSNEAALTIEGLTKTLENLRVASTQVSSSLVAWSNARIDRNNAMYNQDESMYRTGLAVKKYVRALYGPASEQYTLVKKVRFTKPSKG